MAKVLLVEDEDSQRRTVESMLVAGGHEVLLAGNGAQAIVVARDRRPEVLVSDILMPKVSGTDLCRQIRETPELADTYLLLVTARDDDQVKLDSLLAGADDFLHKPVGKEELLARVQIGLRIRRMRRQNIDLQGRVGTIDRERAAIAEALGGIRKAMEEAVVRLGSEDVEGARGALRVAHEGLRKASAVLPPPPAAADPPAGA